MRLEKRNGAIKIIDYPFGHTFLLSLPLTCLHILSIKSNMKMLTVLFVLLYIRYKGHVMCQILDSKDALMIVLPSEPSTAM